METIEVVTLHTLDEEGIPLYTFVGKDYGVIRSNILKFLMEKAIEEDRFTKEHLVLLEANKLHMLLNKLLEEFQLETYSDTSFFASEVVNKEELKSLYLSMQ